MELDTLRRLAICRHLYRQGVEQSRAVDALASLAILPFHDAVEIFLQLACEKTGASLGRRSEFDAYWTSLKEKGVDVGYRESMQRLNRSRVGLKHAGILPDRTEIEGLRASVTNFLTDESFAIFQVDFHTVTRSFLIRDQNVRAIVEAAESARREPNHGLALENAMKAFLHVIRYQGHDGPYDPRSRIHSIVFFKLDTFHDNRDRKIGEALKEMSDVFGEALMVVGYQLDFAGYQLLRRYAPVIHQIYNGDPIVEWLEEPTKDSEIVDTCIEFVIDCCLRLEAQAPAFNTHSSAAE